MLCPNWTRRRNLDSFRRSFFYWFVTHIGHHRMSEDRSRSPAPTRRFRSERTTYRDAPYRRDRPGYRCAYIVWWYIFLDDRISLVVFPRCALLFLTLYQIFGYFKVVYNKNVMLVISQAIFLWFSSFIITSISLVFVLTIDRGIAFRSVLIHKYVFMFMNYVL